MKTIARLALFGVAALLAVPANAQMTRSDDRSMQPGQGQPFQPGPGQPELEYPYAPPPGFAPPDGSQPQQAPMAEHRAASRAGTGDRRGAGAAPGRRSRTRRRDRRHATTTATTRRPTRSSSRRSIRTARGSTIRAMGGCGSRRSTLVGDDFAPYATSGHWILTEYGWTWISDFGWGWAPFHYGRWLALAGRGWCWMPGTTWGPAWVSWRAGGGYVGWAPLPPRGVSVAAGSAPHSPWRFAYATSLGGAHPTYVSPRQVPGLFARTTVVANDRLLTRGSYTVHVNAGPVRGATMAPVRLATVAPRALPQARDPPPHRRLDRHPPVDTRHLRAGASLPGAGTGLCAAAGPSRRAAAGTTTRRGRPRPRFNRRTTMRPGRRTTTRRSRRTGRRNPRTARRSRRYRAPAIHVRSATDVPRAATDAHLSRAATCLPRIATDLPRAATRLSRAATRLPDHPRVAGHVQRPARGVSGAAILRQRNANPAPTRYVPQGTFHAPAASAPAPQTFPAPATHFGNGGGGPRFEAAPAGGGAHFGGAPAGGGGAQLRRRASALTRPSHDTLRARWALRARSLRFVPPWRSPRWRSPARRAWRWPTPPRRASTSTRGRPTSRSTSTERRSTSSRRPTSRRPIPPSCTTSRSATATSAKRARPWCTTGASCRLRPPTIARAPPSRSESPSFRRRQRRRDVARRRPEPAVAERSRESPVVGCPTAGSSPRGARRRAAGRDAGRRAPSPRAARPSTSRRPLLQEGVVHRDRGRGGGREARSPSGLSPGAPTSPPRRSETNPSFNETPARSALRSDSRSGAWPPRAATVNRSWSSTSTPTPASPASCACTRCCPTAGLGGRPSFPGKTRDRRR